MQSLARRLTAGGALPFFDVAAAAQPFFAALLQKLFPQHPVVVVTENLKTQESFQQDLETWLGTSPQFYPAWETLPHEDKLPHADVISDRLQTAMLSGRDPAEILEAEGTTALRAILQDHVQPLSAVVIDAHIAPWERRLRDPEGPLLAMRNVATVIAGLLPAEAAAAIRQITRNKELTTIDENMQPSPTRNCPRSLARCRPTPHTRSRGWPNGSASRTTQMS